jgi:acyl-CoA synthetase (AMP-forming)/AMP-acid ligase II
VSDGGQGRGVARVGRAQKRSGRDGGDLREYCREKLAPTRFPLAVHFRKELPKTTVGKVLRPSARRDELIG